VCWRLQLGFISFHTVRFKPNVFLTLSTPPADINVVNVVCGQSLDTPWPEQNFHLQE
jgi:hypothetical protein